VISSFFFLCLFVRFHTHGHPALLFCTSSDFRAPARKVLFSSPKSLAFSRDLILLFFCLSIGGAFFLPVPPFWDADGRLNPPLFRAYRGFFSFSLFSPARRAFADSLFSFCSGTFSYELLPRSPSGISHLSHRFFDSRSPDARPELAQFGSLLLLLATPAHPGPFVSLLRATFSLLLRA